MLQGSAASVSVALHLNAAPLLASLYQSARVRGRCLFQQKDVRLDRWTPFCVVEETSMNRMFYACPAAFDFINITQVEVRKSPNFYKFVFFLFSLSFFLILSPLIPRKIPAPLGRKRRGGCLFLKRRFSGSLIRPRCCRIFLFGFLFYSGSVSFSLRAWARPAFCLNANIPARNKSDRNAGALMRGLAFLLPGKIPE